MPKKKHNQKTGGQKKGAGGVYTPLATFILTLSVVGLLVVAGWLPEVEGLRGVDVFSELKHTHPTPADGALETDDLLARFDDGYAALEVVEPPVVVAPVVKPQRVDTVRKAKVTTTDTLPPSTPKCAAVDGAGRPITLIEDFSSSSAALTDFFAKLRDARRMTRPVRIAVVGDSFIEGDIFTQDLRALLQARFGGRGVGFVPITSQVAGFRQSVGHTFSGWSTVSMVNKPQRGGYLLSSYLYTPKGSSSSAQYKGALVRPYLDYFSRARLLFVNQGGAQIEVQTNNGNVQHFSPPVSDRLSQVVVVEDTIRSVGFTVSGSNDDFTAYGAYLDDGCGVNVDNYSVRGNSGTAMASIDGVLMAQLHAIQPIDMVIVQYGLNVAQADAKAYTLYQTQMQRVVSHLRNVLPGVVVLVLGIPDRTHRTADGWATMPGVEAMARAQRSLAQATGALYWSTLEAMRARGGMSKFVERGWAAKDYTHLSAGGGREVGRALFDAMMYEMDQK